MIARKVKPGVLEIVDVDLSKEIESHTLIEISDKDAYLLLTTSKGFKVGDNNKTTISFKDGDATDVMFKAIAEKHKKEEGRTFLDVSKKYNVDDVKIEGTSVLIRDVENRIIRVARRETTNCKQGSINRLFVTNYERDLFFDCARVSNSFKTTGKFMLDASLDAKDYDTWSAYMNDRYVEIVGQVGQTKSKKELKKRAY